MGYSLYFSIQQRDNYIDSLFEKVSRAAQIHQQRNLSVRGRATVINTLILSKLWHVFRVLPIPKTALNRFQSMVSSFVNHHMWPNFAKDTFQLHRLQGGFSILNLETQLKHLQWRWLLPLLQNSVSSSFSQFRATHYIRYCLQLYCNYQDVRFPLIFKEMRPPAWSNRLSPLTNLYRAMEGLEPIFRYFTGPLQTPVNYVTSLQLPLNAIWEPKEHSSSQPNPFANKPGVLRCKVSDIYCQDPQSQVLRIKSFAEITLHPHPLITRKFKQVLESDQVIKFKPFFLQTLQVGQLPTDTETNIDASPWITEFNFWLKNTRFQYLGSISIESLQSKEVKKLLNGSTPTAERTQIWTQISYNRWLRFWNTGLHSQARNIWMRRYILSNFN